VALLRSCLRTWMLWWVVQWVLSNMCRTRLGMTRLHCQHASWTHCGPQCKPGQPVWWKQCLRNEENWISIMILTRSLKCVWSESTSKFKIISFMFMD
jgi:hypothetical protein